MEKPKKYFRTIAIICFALLCLTILFFMGNNTQNNIRSQDSKSELLFWAIENNDLIEVKSLLENGADPNRYYAGSYHIAGIPLVTASIENKLEIAKLLLEYGADPNIIALEGNNRPIIYAAFYDHLEMLKLLLKNGADPNIEGRLGTPMTAAAYFGNFEIVKFLLEYGIDPNSNYPLIIAIKTYPSMHRDKAEIVELLLKSGANPNIQDNLGMTPLHYAAYRSTLKMVKILLNVGADPNIPDNIGTTPIYAAAFSGQLKVVKLLLYNIKNEYDTPIILDVIKKNNKVEIAKLFANYASPTTKAAGVYFAVYSGEIEILKILLKNGADPNTRYMDTTPIDYALQHQVDPKIIKLLVKHGAKLDPQQKEWIKKYIDK